MILDTVITSTSGSPPRGGRKWSDNQVLVLRGDRPPVGITRSLDATFQRRR